MTEKGIKVRFDDFGNIYGRIEGTDPNSTVVMTGSHLDTVPNGGKFDGILGVLGALEVVESFLENGIKHRRPIEIVSFTNEEGARFTPQMLGSGSVTGHFSQKYTYERKDDAGYKFSDELKKIGFLGEEKNRLTNVGTFIELHIEQGPILETNDNVIGVVNGIAGFSWFEVIVKGKADHSGTTPMKYRQDSLVATASVIQKINNWAKNRDDGTVVTVGKINNKPDIINVIPAETTFTVDIRNHDKNNFNQCVNEIKRIIDETIRFQSLDYLIKEIRAHPPTQFSSSLVSMIENICKKHQITYRTMTSGAGHDALYMNNIAETAMIFVPSMNGKSHCEEEYTSWEDIEVGVKVLYEVMKQLSQ